MNINRRALLEYETQLASVRKAILEIESGAQSYKIGSREYIRPDLPILYAREKELENKIATEKRCGSIKSFFM